MESISTNLVHFEVDFFPTNSPKLVKFYMRDIFGAFSKLTRERALYTATIQEVHSLVNLLDR